MQFGSRKLTHLLSALLLLSVTVSAAASGGKKPHTPAGATNAMAEPDGGHHAKGGHDQKAAHGKAHAQHSPLPRTPQGALTNLRQGNERFV